MNKKFIILILFITFFLAAINARSERIFSKNKPVVINADRIDYDKESNIITASGNVELISDKQILVADKVVYFKDSDIAEADGNVTVLDEAGNVAFADQASLSEKMTKGHIKDISIRFKNQAAFAAESAEKINEKQTILYNSVYSACKVKKDYPLWQIKSDKSLIDEELEKVSHKNARLEVYGYPVIYTPYFSHPTPKASRKSGFLIPSYASNDDLGTSVEIPYYYNIAPNFDTTITLKAYTEQNPLLKNEFRMITENSKTIIKSSITNPTKENLIKKRYIKGHIFANTEYNLPNNWLLTANFNRAHDKTYLKRYDINDQLYYLTSNLDLEKYTSNEHYLIKNMFFQDLRSTYNDMPRVLPHAEYSLIVPRGEFNEQFFANISALNLMRDDYAKMKRTSASVGVELPFNAFNGHLFNWTNSLRIDGYSTKKVSRRNQPLSEGTLEGETGRVLPQTSLFWEYPLFDGHNIITPVANIIYSPYGSNPEKIPNEDSTNVEITDNNIFKDNRYAGFDMVETGLRGGYGIRVDTKLYKYQTDLFFGQSFRKKENQLMPHVSGLGNHYSDYVGHILFNPSENLRLFYRFRLDHKNFAWHRNEIGARGSINNKLGAGFIYHAADLRDQNSLRKQKSITADASYNLNKTTSFSVNSSKILTKRSITPNRGMINAGFNLNYNHHCADLSFSVKRNFTRDRDIRPDTLYLLKITLKTLN
ncbi:MAG: LPS-assembly protein LptD [Sphingobacteriia bacterium]|nr:LPS-assembly protein LptD [Sphingobacteriia bacterium]